MKNIRYKFRLAPWLIAIAITLNTATVSAALGIDYTENLLEITDRGVFTPDGRPVTESSAEGSAGTEKKTPEPALQPAPITGGSLEEYQNTIMNSWGGKKAYTEKRLQGIRESLETELSNFKVFSDRIGEAEAKLAPLEKQVTDLNGQIAVFNEQLRLTREKVTDVEKQIAEKQLAMRDLMEEEKKAKVSLRVQQEAVLSYITLLYDEESEFVDVYGNSGSTLKLLLADNSVSENFFGKEYVSVMEQTGRKVFHDMEESYLALKEKQAGLLLGQTKLNRLYASLDQEKKIMEETRHTKQEMLAKAETEKESYEKLLEESIHQQLESSLAIQNMKDNIGLIESKLKLMPDDPIVENTTFGESLTDTPEIPVPGDNQTGSFFAWPVPPNAVTAYFHDPTYPAKWGTHQALDIRAPQYTEIRAPAHGYVVEAKDNGFGYSYIILAHKKNLVTVYGHVSEIRVKTGMLVSKGDVIGLTGGTPGTKGAGLQTTGPHLHFETHFKGEPVEPLDYLPVLQLPIEYIPDRYLKR